MGLGSTTRYDPEADVLYLYSKGGEIAQTVEVAPAISVDYGDDGDILGIEILRASKVLAEDIIASLHQRQTRSA